MTLEGIINITRENPEKAAEVIRRWLSEDQDYTGSEKAAVLMASVNFETVNKIYRYLRKDEIEKIALKVEQLEKIDERKNDSGPQKLIDLKKTNSILREFNEKLKSRLSDNKDGADYANKLLGTRKP
jgi:flagellar motor switch protein FliG